MIAITTSNSTSVKPGRFAIQRREDGAPRLSVLPAANMAVNMAVLSCLKAGDPANQILQIEAKR